MCLKLSYRSEGSLDKADCRYYHFEESGLDLIVCATDASEGVYGNIILETPMLSKAPLSYGVERMIHGGTDSFGKDFVWRLAREVSGAFINSHLSSDFTCYTITADTDNGLIALIGPYLDAIFATQFSKQRYIEVIRDSAANASEGDWLSELYPQESIYSNAPVTAQNDLGRIVSLADLQNYHKTYYRLSNCTIVIGGQVKPEEMRDVISCCADGLREAWLPAPKISSSLRRQHALRQPDLPTLPKPSRSRAQTAKIYSTPLVRFKSVLEDPLNSAPKIPTLLVSGNLSGFTDQLFDVHLVLQGPDFSEPTRWTAFQLMAQHICRVYNELIELKHMPPSDLTEEATELIFDPGDSNAFNLSFRRRRNMLAVFTACGVKADQLYDTINNLPEFIRGLPDIKDCVWSFKSDMIEAMLHHGWLVQSQERELRAEFDVVTSLSQWAKYSKAELKNPKYMERAKESYEFACSATRVFEYLRKQPETYWFAQYDEFWKKQKPLVVVKPTSDLILYPSNLCSSTSALGGCFGGQELCREKHWDKLVDAEVDAYLRSIGV